MLASQKLFYLATCIGAHFGGTLAAACPPPMSSCIPITADAAQSLFCHGFFTSNSIPTSTCSTTVTAPTPVTTVSVTKIVSSTVTLTTTLSVFYTGPASTVTVPVTTTKISTSTTRLTNTNIVTSLTVITSGIDTTTYAVTVTTTSYTNADTLLKRKARRATSLPAGCDCFTAKSQTLTKTPATSTTRVTATITTWKTATRTSRTTITIHPADFTTTKIVATVIVTSIKTIISSRTVTLHSTTVIPATTVTFTLTTTTTIKTTPPTPDISCGNLGIEVGIYDNPYDADETTGDPNFDPDYFKASTPYDTRSGIQMLGLQTPGERHNPHSFTFPLDGDFVLNYRGYLYAPFTGTYTINILNQNNYVAFWIGSKALTAWDKENADIIFHWGPGLKTDTIHTYLIAGSYTPFRFLLGSYTSDASFILEILNLENGNFLSFVEYQLISDYIVSSSCDGATPPFPAFGSEHTIPSVPDTSCNNAGFSVGIYDDPYIENPESDDYASFVPEFFKTQIPFSTTQTTYMGIVNAGDQHTPYGFHPNSPGNYVLNYRGYFYAPESRVYTFKLYNGDNWAGIWTTNALEGWTRGNANATTIWNPSTMFSTSGQIQVPLAKGAYFPIRLMLGSYGGGVQYRFDIWDDLTSTYYLTYGTSSAYLVSQSCSGITLPYPAFGQEA